MKDEKRKYMRLGMVLALMGWPTCDEFLVTENDIWITIIEDTVSHEATLVVQVSTLWSEDST